MYQTKLKMAIVDKFGHPGGQQRLAEKLGISHSVLSGIVTGRLNPTDDERRNIAEAMRMAQKDLFGDNGGK